jgi:hypothetical protein
MLVGSLPTAYYMYSHGQVIWTSLDAQVGECVSRHDRWYLETHYVQKGGKNHKEGKPHVGMYNIYNKESTMPSLWSVPIWPLC